jgi:hypothetical protein
VLKTHLLRLQFHDKDQTFVREKRSFYAYFKDTLKVKNYFITDLTPHQQYISFFELNKVDSTLNLHFLLRELLLSFLFSSFLHYCHFPIQFILSCGRNSLFQRPRQDSSFSWYPSFATSHCWYLLFEQLHLQAKQHQVSLAFKRTSCQKLSTSLLKNHYCATRKLSSYKI